MFSVLRSRNTETGFMRMMLLSPSSWEASKCGRSRTDCCRESLPERSMDGSVLIKHDVGIMARWTEHYTDLFDNPSSVDESVINGLPQKGIIAGKMTVPNIDEIKFTNNEVNTGKAPGLDGIPVELLRFGGDNVSLKIHAFIIAVWNGDPTPQSSMDI